MGKQDQVGKEVGEDEETKGEVGWEEKGWGWILLFCIHNMKVNQCFSLKKTNRKAKVNHCSDVEYLKTQFA